MPDYIPPLVMSIHGIRTHAEWQNTLAEILSAAGIQFKNRRFGYYPITSFIRAAKNQKHVDEFVDWYFRVVESAGDRLQIDDPARRPSVIAHSFGSFIVGHSMLKYPEIKFDKIILCGCILPLDFDWHTLFVRGQLSRVRNECGGKDVWVALAPYGVRDTGPSGRKGFRSLSNRCSDEFYDYQRHSDFFTEAHIQRTWLPFLKMPPHPLRIVHGGDIDDPQEIERNIHRTRAVDRVRFGRVPAHDVVKIPYGYSKRWREVNPDIYTFAIDRRTSKVCGYINAMPVEEWAYAKITTGKMLDPEIPGNAVVPYLSDQRLKLYFMSIAVAPGSTRAGEGLYSELVESLLDALFDRLRKYARKHNIRVTEVAAIGWTEQGMRMCERLFGMKQIGSIEVKDKESVVTHPVYEVQLVKSTIGKLALLHRGLRNLLDLYETME